MNEQAVKNSFFVLQVLVPFEAAALLPLKITLINNLGEKKMADF